MLCLHNDGDPEHNFVSVQFVYRIRALIEGGAAAAATRQRRANTRHDNTQHPHLSSTMSHSLITKLLDAFFSPHIQALLLCNEIELY